MRGTVGATVSLSKVQEGELQAPSAANGSWAFARQVLPEVSGIEAGVQVLLFPLVTVFPSPSTVPSLSRSNRALTLPPSGSVTVTENVGLPLIQVLSGGAANVGVFGVALQGWVLQAKVSVRLSEVVKVPAPSVAPVSRVHSLPLQEGEGLLHVLVCVPPSQLLVQADKAPHAPFTGLLVFEHELKQALEVFIVQVSVVQELLSLHPAFEVQAIVPFAGVDAEQTPVQL